MTLQLVQQLLCSSSRKVQAWNFHVRKVQPVAVEAAAAAAAAVALPMVWS